jgi:uncharacterized protein YqgV (UPF0045/DUF77 family)
MLIELSITPLGTEMPWEAQLADVLELVNSLGLFYQLTPTGTRVEGAGEEVLALVTRCYQRLALASPHVLTMVRIENEWYERADGHVNAPRKAPP